MASGDTRKVILKNKDDEYLIPYTEVASSTTVGRVKPDGTTTSVDSNGAMSVIGKQDTLVSGTNIKTVNGNSLLGSGNVTIGAQVSYGNITGTLSDQTDLQDALDAKANDIDVVKLTGNQTVAGEKTFTSRMRFTQQCPTIRNNNDDWSTAPAEQIYYQWGCEDKNGIWLGGFEGNHLTDGSYTKGMYVRQQNGSAYASIIVGIRPDGSVWTSVPTPATSDSSSKIATTANVDAKITAQAVKLTGDQTIAGNKFFTGSVIVNTPNDARIRTYAPNLTNGTTPTAIQWAGCDLQDKNGVEMAEVLAWIDTSGKSNSGLWVRAPGTNTTAFGVKVIGDTNGNIYTSTITPATTDNSTKIATTAYVNNKLGANFQVVTALPASPTAGVFYFVKE